MKKNNTTSPSTARPKPTPKKEVKEARAITVAIVAMGGEGGGVLADWIVHMAEQAGYYAQSTSVPGVAQRTGSTVYYLEMFSQSDVPKNSPPPVFALMPIPGDVDVVIASELMEAGRAIQRGIVTPDRTTFIASTHRMYSMTEKTTMGDGRVNAPQLLEAGRSQAKRFINADFSQLAEQAGSPISAALFGALAASESLPFARSQFESVIESTGIGVQNSLKAFHAGFEIALAPPPSSDAQKIEPEAEVPKVKGKLITLAQKIKTTFPTNSHFYAISALKRLTEYQDTLYAKEYFNRLRPFVALEKQLITAQQKETLILVREVARHLALWMSYEDVIRVADLKVRRSRFERTREELKQTDDQIVKIHEFLHPRIEEIADILPVTWGRWLLNSRWMCRCLRTITSRGRIVQTTSLGGYLLFYGLAALRPIRRKSLRFHMEEVQIKQWLKTIIDIAPQDYDLALQVIECQRLVKGYGDTHKRGMENFKRVLNVLPQIREQENPAPKFKLLIQAALADEQGKALEIALLEWKNA